jgi:branched-chain amino acid transport system permease protein
VSLVWERWPLILGVALVVVVLFLRGGLVEALTRIQEAIGGRRARPEADEDVRVTVTAEGEAGR